MTPEELNEIEQLAQEATPAPWCVAIRGEEVTIETAGIECFVVAEMPRSGSTNRHNAAFIRAMREYVLSMVKEVRRLQEVEAASRLFGMVVPPCDCGAYENSTKPCSANCRIDVRFRTAIGGEAQVSP